MNIPKKDLDRLASNGMSLLKKNFDVSVEVGKLLSAFAGMFSKMVSDKISEIKIPEIKVPEIKIPKIEIPDVTVRVPEIKIPEIRIPEVRIPDVKVECKPYKKWKFKLTKDKDGNTTDIVATAIE